MKNNAADKISNFFSKRRLLTYKNGERIIQPGDIPSNVYYVKNGYVRKYIISKDGNELTEFIHLESTFFPITKIVNAFPNPCYYEVATNTAQIYTAPEKEFFDFINKDPEILLHLLTYTAKRAYYFHEMIRYCLLGNSFYRVLAVLRYLANLFGERNENSATIKYKFTHEEIAALSSLSRETVSREIEKVTKKGLVEYRSRYISLKDIEEINKELSSVI